MPDLARAHISWHTLWAGRLHPRPAHTSRRSGQMPKPLPEISLLRQLIDYNPTSGQFIWAYRPVTMFGREWKYHQWNNTHAGKECFITPRGAGYLGGCVLGVKLKSHRVAWALHHGSWPIYDIDHINHDRTDNRIANLRHVHRSENNKNRPPQKNNRSGFVGIAWNPECRKWKCDIGHEGANVYLGVHACIGVAIRARRNAERSFGFHENHGGAA